jgi:colanic acid/amylovoran biosynthesis glycosyltransferase
MLIAAAVRICLLLASYPVVSETFIWEAVRWLSDAGHDISIVTERRGSLPEAREGSDRPPVVPTVCLPESTFRLLLSSPLRVVATSLSLLRSRPARPFKSLLRALPDPVRQADVLLAHFGTEGLKWMPAASLAGRPLAVFFHGLDATEVLSRAPRYYDSLFASRVGLVTNSEYLKGCLVAAGASRERVAIVPYGTDPALTRTTPESTRTARRILTIARLVEKKGVADALRAFARVQPQLEQPWTFEIVGDGPLRAELEALAGTLGIEESVEFRGALPRAEVFAALRRCSVFVLASKVAPSGDTEGTPVSIIEAATLGRAVVSTLHAGIPEIVPKAAEPCGYLVAEGDVDALARAFERLARDPEERERWGNACRTFATERHSAPAHVDALVRALGQFASVPAQAN